MKSISFAAVVFALGMGGCAWFAKAAPAAEATIVDCAKTASAANFATVVQDVNDALSVQGDDWMTAAEKLTVQFGIDFTKCVFMKVVSDIEDSVLKPKLPSGSEVVGVYSQSAPSELSATNVVKLMRAREWLASH